MPVPVIQAVILLLAVAAAFRDGERRTNARWHRWATKVERGHEYDVRKWHHRPGWHRAGVRFDAVLVILEALWGLLAARGVTIAVLAAVAPRRRCHGRLAGIAARAPP